MEKCLLIGDELAAELLRPDRTEKFVALAIHGERRPKD